jgi:hypothetical protein
MIKEQNVKSIVQYVLETSFENNYIQKVASSDPNEEKVNIIINEMKKNNDVKNGEIADKWHDGYFHVILYVKGDKSSRQFYKNRSYEDGYIFKDLKNIVTTIKNILKKHNAYSVNVEVPNKKREYTDPLSSYGAAKTYYLNNEIKVEFYLK